MRPFTMDDRDIDCTAERLIDEYGGDALMYSIAQTDARIEAGDVQGVTVWKQVMKAIDALKPGGGGTRH